MAAYPPNTTSLAVAEADELDLIEASRERDVRAFEELYRRYRRAVKELCLKWVGDAALAEDLAQETFTRAFAHMDRFRDGCRFWPWIAAIARNLSVDVLRVSPRCLPTEIADDESFASLFPGETMDVSDHVIHRHEAAGMRARLAAALGALTPRERRILWLKHAEGWSYEEIARVDGSSVDAARNAAYRARGAARVLLQASGAGTPALGLVPAAILALREFGLRVREVAARAAHRVRLGPTQASLGERVCATFTAVAVLSVVWVADGVELRRADAATREAAGPRPASVLVADRTPERGDADAMRRQERATVRSVEADTSAITASMKMKQRQRAAAPSASNLKLEVRDPNGKTVTWSETWFECTGDVEYLPAWSPVVAYC